MQTRTTNKLAGGASVILGFVAWLGQKLGWFTAKVGDTLTLISLLCGVAAMAE